MVSSLWSSSTLYVRCMVVVAHSISGKVGWTLMADCMVSVVAGSNFD
jgi:hypothetical protein